VHKTNNIIKINGQHYDATTGALVTSAVPGSESVAARSPKPITVTEARPEPVKPSAVRPAARQPGKQPAGRGPKPSRTLMRRAVHKPGPSLKRRVKAQGHTDTLAETPLGLIKSSHSVQQLDAKRLQHASQVAKSHFVRHFSPPEAKTGGQVPAAPASQPDTAAAKVLARPAAPTAQPAGQARPAKHSPTTADLLSRAIEQATSHQQPPPAQPAGRGRAKRNVAIGAAIGLPVLVLGLIVTQNLSSVRLQTASAKAGFSASLPDYHPAGFSLGQLNYSAGVVAAQFHSNSDNRGYTITQKQSLWDSADLRDNFVATSDPGYQTVQAGGRTIYLYGQGEATWVNNGIWYVIQGNGSLSEHQLVELASSL
jgi:hypothetical protein